MNNPEFEPDILKSIDKSGYSEKQSAKQIDTKGTIRQQIKHMSKQPTKIKKTQSEVIFESKKGR